MSGRSLATAITVAVRQASERKARVRGQKGPKKREEEGRTKDGVEDEEEEDGRRPLKGKMEGLSGGIVGPKVEEGAADERDRDAFASRKKC